MMKKSRPQASAAGADRPQAAAAGIDRPSSASSTSSRGHSSSNCSTPRKNSAPDKSGTPGKALTKSLSKSHDNLASTLRKRAVQVSMAGSKEAMRTASPGPKFKTPKTPATPIRKSQSTPQIDKSDTPIHRTQSAQNISRVPSGKPGSKQSKVKRASSTQNISNKSSGRHVRISTPVNAMAYNAELLASFEKEKKCLERRISELIQVAENRKTEIEKFKFQVKNLKQKIPSISVNDTLTSVLNENCQLKEKLKELGEKVDHFMDSELLLQSVGEEAGAVGGGDAGSITGTRTNGSVSDAFDLANTPDSDGGFPLGDIAYLHPDHPTTMSFISMDNNWDKQSNKSSDGMSEVSVACLQDRIVQMEENHYSTNEELQATLQELGDLQDNVNQLTYENERLTDEKSVLLESLCAQTEKLENARRQVEHLKILLVSDSEGGERSENERQLVGLVKSTQEEKDELLLRQVEFSHALHGLENENREMQDVITAVRDKARILEMKLESVTTDKRTMDMQISELREATAKDAVELQRYRTLLENEKQKVVELAQERNATDKSDLEALLDGSRGEKERLEGCVANLEEEVAMRQNEVLRLKEQMASLEEEVKVCKNNAKTQVSAMEYEVSRVEEGRNELQQELARLRDHINSLTLDRDRYAEEKKAHISTVASVEHELASARQRVNELESLLKEAKRSFEEKQGEWTQFQADLQTAVVIANNFKSEAQANMEKVLLDKFNLKEENDNLRSELHRLKDDLELARQQGPADSIRRSDIRGKVMSTLDRELSSIRLGRKASDPWGGNSSLSVKHLIKSIEEQVKCDRCTPPLSLSPTPSSPETSRRNSLDSCMLSIKAESLTQGTGVDRRSGSALDYPKSVLRRSDGMEKRPSSGYRHTISGMILETPATAEDVVLVASPGDTDMSGLGKKSLTGILAHKKHKSESSPPLEPCVPNESEGKQEAGYTSPLLHGTKGDPLANLAKQMGGSKRNALLKWCQMKTTNYTNIDITNFSSSWNDGLALCAIIHTYLPDQIPYKELSEHDKLRNFTVAFKAAESINIPSILNVHDMVSMERPDWQAVMAYITSIYKHFEVDKPL